MGISELNRVPENPATSRENYLERILSAKPIWKLRASDFIPIRGIRDYKGRNFNPDATPDSKEGKLKIVNRLSILECTNFVYAAIVFVYPAYQFLKVGCSLIDSLFR